MFTLWLRHKGTDPNAMWLGTRVANKTSIDLRIRIRATRVRMELLGNTRGSIIISFALAFPAFSRNLFFSLLGMNEYIVGIAEALFLGLPDLAECSPVL